MLIKWSRRLVGLLFLLSFQLIAFMVETKVIKLQDNTNSPGSDDGSLETWSRLANAIPLPKNTKQLLRKTLNLQFFVPLSGIIMGLLVICTIFPGESRRYRNEATDCRTSLDADISGDGVRISVWAQIGVLIFISAMGVFHTYDTAIKEVAGGLILTHISLVVALTVQMRRGTLQSVDAAIGAAILDAQNMALHIPLTAKETLAARWQVMLLIPTQILGLVVLPVIVVGLNSRKFASADCKCFYMFWWSWISDCDEAHSDGHGLSLFWTYYTVRLIMLLQSSFTSLYNTEWFHRSEKSERHGKTTPVEKATINPRLPYNGYAATISLSCSLHAMYALTSMAVAEVTIRNFGLRPSSQVYSVGQIIAIVVAGATILRAIWKFGVMFNQGEAKSFPDLVFALVWNRCAPEDPEPHSVKAKKRKGRGVRSAPRPTQQRHKTFEFRQPFHLKTAKMIYLPAEDPEPTLVIASNGVQSTSATHPATPEAVHTPRVSPVDTIGERTGSKATRSPPYNPSMSDTGTSPHRLQHPRAMTF